MPMTKQKAKLRAHEYIKQRGNATKTILALQPTMNYNVATNAASRMLGDANFNEALIEIIKDKGLSKENISVLLNRNMKQAVNIPASNQAIDIWSKMTGAYKPERKETQTTNLNINLDTRIHDLEQELLRAKRQQRATTLPGFINAYLRHLAPIRRPIFHKEIFNLLESQLRANNNELPKGYDVPPLPPNNYIKSNTQISGKNKQFRLQHEIQKEQGIKYNRLLFIAPRGFSKSSICSRFFPLYLALHGYKKDIFLVSATIALAKENLRVIRTELENNELLVKDFGDLKSDKWTEEQLT